MIGNLVIEIEPAEPPISQVQLNLLAQPPLEADAVAVANDQHPDHELRIDRRSTDVAIERCQLLAQVSQHLHYNRIDPAQEMARLSPSHQDAVLSAYVRRLRPDCLAGVVGLELRNVVANYAFERSPGFPGI